MKRLIAVAGIFLVLVLSFPAAAQNASGRGRFAQGGGRGGAQSRQAPPQRPPAREASPQQERRDGRMTPDERQQLRRDIQDHGRDIYRDRPARRQ